MNKFDTLIEAAMPNQDLIEEIKTYLYTEAGETAWEDYVDNQSLGECQGIVAGITKKFKGKVKKVFGHITTDEPYYSQDAGEELDEMTHHWVTINKVPYDFSKGTLRGYVEFDDVNDPEVEDESIYSPL